MQRQKHVGQSLLRCLVEFRLVEESVKLLPPSVHARRARNDEARAGKCPVEGRVLMRLAQEMRVYEVACTGLVQLREVDERSSHADVADLDGWVLARRLYLGIRTVDGNSEPD